MKAVWVAVDGEEIVSAHLREHRKRRDIRREPRVALSVGAPGTTATGLPEYLVRYGRARIVEGGAVPRHQRLARLYMGPNADFPPPAVRVLDGYVTHIAPERIAGVGPWAPHR